MLNHIANVTLKAAEWNFIDWNKANRIVKNLRQRIFRASTGGDIKKVRSLQKLMLRCYSNILISVRRVTQINKGKNTPGVDKLTVKTPAARAKLVERLSTYTPWKAKPVKRIYIPKKEKGKKRPLGIPVIADRALQAMVKNALEPYWEAQFEGTSYGFRPGRGCHDAIARIYCLANARSSKKWVYDADIRGAFDHVNWDHLLKTIGNFPARELIKQWLKAGYVEFGELHKNTSGTPQGGVVSPLLLNIALHGMEEALGVKYSKRGTIISERAVVRYADDFVVFCKSKEDTEAASETLKTWLGERGLEISEEKTKIVHLSEGFNFLGFNVRQYEVSASRSEWKLLIKPSKEAVKKSKEKLREAWRSMRGHSVGQVLFKLNPIIRGQANYYRPEVASRTFHMLDNYLYWLQRRWTKRSHPNKSRTWANQKYWGTLNHSKNDRWVFRDKQTGQYMLKYSWFPIERHTLVKGKASPDDPTLKDYWKKRNLRNCNNLPSKQKSLAKKQNGLCPICMETLFNKEELQIDHIVPKSQGGSATDVKNLQLIHYFCHQQKTYQEKQ